MVKTHTLSAEALRELGLRLLAEDAGEYVVRRPSGELLRYYKAFQARDAARLLGGCFYRDLDFYQRAAARALKEV